MTITTSIVSGNSASNLGGGIHNSDELMITNSVISGNSASNSSGGIDNSDILSNITLENSIVWGNDAPTNPQIGNESTLNLAHSGIEGGTAPISGTVNDNGGNWSGINANHPRNNRIGLFRDSDSTSKYGSSLVRMGRTL